MSSPSETDEPAEKQLDCDPMLEKDYRKRKKAIMNYLNQKHCVVYMDGKTRILNETVDADGNPDISFSSFDDFRNRYCNRTITMSPAEGKAGIRITWGKLWLTSNSPRRNEKQGVVFKPGIETPHHYNLWKGFAVTPKPGDWSLLKSHIFENICSGNEKWFEYLMAWMANIVQNPCRKSGVAIVQKGEKGTGKSTWAEFFGSLFGNHFLPLCSQKQLVNGFNYHLKNKILIVSEELQWKDDKTAEGILKHMITGDYFLIEPKGENAFRIENYLNLIINSNEKKVIPAGMDERRFLMLEVGENHKQDIAYFEAIRRQMNEGGGREAMLHDLMNHRIPESVRLQTAPKTPALLEQILQNGDPVQKFWYQALQDGINSKSRNEWLEWIRTDDLYEDFKSFCQDIGVKNSMIKDEFCKQSKRLCRMKYDRKKIYGHDEKRYAGYAFEPLDECRKFFEKVTGIEKTDLWDDRVAGLSDKASENL